VKKLTNLDGLIGAHVVSLPRFPFIAARVKTTHGIVDIEKCTPRLQVADFNDGRLQALLDTRSVAVRNPKARRSSFWASRVKEPQISLQGSYSRGSIPGQEVQAYLADAIRVQGMKRLILPDWDRSNAEHALTQRWNKLTQLSEDASSDAPPRTR